jgi:hypothetical protein
MDNKFKEIDDMQELKIISPMDKSLKTIIELMRSYYDE